MSIPVTNSGGNNAELATALAGVTKYLSDAEKENVKVDKNVLNHLVTVIQQYESNVQTEQASAPAIPDPPGTLEGDLKSGISVFGSNNEINISYIVSLVLALTSLESEQLSKQFELQAVANQLQYKAGVAAADDALAASVAGAVGSFTSAALSVASLGLEALGAYKDTQAGNAATAKLNQSSAESGVSKEVEEAEGGSKSAASTESELQGLGGNRSAKPSGNTTTTETELQNAKNQNKATATADQQGTERASESGSKTRENVARTERNANLNTSEATQAETNTSGPGSANNSTSTVSEKGTSPSNEFELEDLSSSRSGKTTGGTGATEAESSLNEPNAAEGTSTQRSNAATTGEPSDTKAPSSESDQNVANQQSSSRASSSESAEGTSNQSDNAAITGDSSNTREQAPLTDQNEANQQTDPRAGTSDDSKAQAPEADRNAADPQNNPRTGASDETRNTEQTSANKTSADEAEKTEKSEKSKPPTDFDKLVSDLRKAIRPDLDQKVTELDKLRAYEKAYDRVNTPFSIGAKGLQSAASAVQGAGQLAQGGLTRLQLIEQANAQLNSASAQSASQTIQQLQEVINNARNLVNGLVQSEFSLSRSA